MEQCLVVGKIWATKKRPELENYSLLLLKPLDAEKPEIKRNFLVAVNTVNAKVGENVLVAFGSGARNALGDQQLPIDAAVVGIVDPEVEE
jgi:ethanolamine utilization protein EutN